MTAFSLLVPFAASPQNAHRHHRGRRPRFGSIPYFGPVILSGGLLVVGLVQGGELAQALLMSGVALLITSLVGWLLTPLLLGKVENMSALTVFIGLMLWT